MMTSFGIDIGPSASTALGQQLSWTASFPKESVEGTRFNLYAGFYYYLITTGHHKRLLRAERLVELECVSKFQYQNVIGLETHLEATLLHNLRRHPMILQAIRDSRETIVWNDPLRGLRNRERRWLRVVRRVVDRIRRDCL